MKKIKRKMQVGTFDLNLNPMLDLLMTIILFLILSVEFIQFSMLPADLPAVGSSSESDRAKKDKEPLNLTVVINDRGFVIGGRGIAEIKTTTQTPTIPKQDNTYDYIALGREMLKIKERHPTETAIVIFPESDVKYEVIVHAMDATREIKQTLNEKEEKKILFPNVILGGGII